MLIPPLCSLFFSGGVIWNSLTTASLGYALLLLSHEVRVSLVCPWDSFPLDMVLACIAVHLSARKCFHQKYFLFCPALMFSSFMFFFQGEEFHLFSLNAVTPVSSSWESLGSLSSPFPDSFLSSCCLSFTPSSPSSLGLFVLCEY